jgi:hypothetical protein
MRGDDCCEHGGDQFFFRAVDGKRIRGDDRQQFARTFNF